jgi:membrane protease YdiL (CAAX protease family)
MNKQQISLAFTLLGLGLLGVFSLLTMTLPLDSLPPELNERFTPEMIRVLVLINPSIFVAIAVLIGVLLHGKVHLGVPVISRLLDREKPQQVAEILLFGAMGGILAGLLIRGIAAAFHPLLPTEFLALNEKVQMSLAARLLYGGITEELLLRFGFMTLVVWGIFKLARRLTPAVYLTAIVISSIVFGLGHFPVAFQAVEAPSAGLLTYILLGNTAGGMIFGWLYWKKGLEAAMLAHMMAHVVMLIGESL